MTEIEKADRAKKRLLIIDDEESNCLVMEAILKKNGFGHVDSVHSGVEGLTALEVCPSTSESETYDAVILDVMLPKTNGFELCKTIRNTWGNDLVIILVTGYSIEDYHARYIESGADDFLTKPLKSSELVGRLRVHLQKRLARKQTQSVSGRLWPDLAMDQIGEYSIVRTLSWSGPVVTYEAVKDDQRCVVKVLTKQAQDYPNVRERFLRERDLLASFDHPNITRNLGSGTFNGLDYLVNEYVEGKSLYQWVQESGRPDLDFVLHVAAQTADALAYVHSKGVVHRDLKLRNVFVQDDGSVKIGDFGVAMVKGSARLTQSGYSIGTPLYMAPEQARNCEITPATDIYAFGANMYHLTMGVPPFSAGNAMEILRKHSTEPVRPMSSGAKKVPDAWNDLIVNRCLAKSPKQRPESMRVVLDEIKALERGLTTTA